MSAADQVERELKLGAWPEFALPELDGLVDGVQVGPPVTQDLDAIYHDTPDLQLLRRGVTLRFRAGEPPSDVWTIKLPSDAADHGLARREITTAGKRDRMPQQFADLTRAWSFGRRLRPVARVHTQRAVVALRDARGHELAVLDDDAVTVLRGRRTLARFRELEVELSNGAPPELLAAVDERLRAAGAEKVPQIPKLGRALGRNASLPWQLEPVALGPKATMADAARAQLMRHLAELVDLHALVLLAAPDAAASAARMATALATEIELFAPLVEVPARARVRGALDWLAAELAALAEFEALSALAQTQAPADARVLTAPLALRLERARSRSARVLRDGRYIRMLEDLRRAAITTPKPTGLAARRVSAAGAKFVRPSWRRLRDEPTGPALHEVEAALELVAAHVPDAATALERVRELHASFDAWRDAVARAARLRKLAGRSEAKPSWAMGVVAGREIARAEDEAKRFAALAADATRKSSWSSAD